MSIATRQPLPARDLMAVLKAAPHVRDQRVSQYPPNTRRRLKPFSQSAQPLWSAAGGALLMLTYVQR